MKRGFALCGALLVATFHGGCKKGGEAAPLSYEGSSTVSDNVLSELISGYERTSGHKFGKVGRGGSGAGFKAVMEGGVAIGGMSRALHSAERAQNPYYAIIAYDALSLYVNEKNPVKELTRAQLKGIFTGAIKSWKELGGSDTPIEAVTEILTGGRATTEFFREVALDEAPFGKTHEIDLPGDCAKYVAAKPNAITAVSAAFAVPGVKEVALDGILPNPATIRSGEYLLSRPLLLVSKAVPEGESKTFFDYVLSPEGQAAIAKKFLARTEGL